MRTLSSVSTLALSYLLIGINSLVSNDPVLPVPLNIAVFTAGLGRIPSTELTNDLKNILPRYFPATEGRVPVHDIQLLLNYEVNSLSDSFLHRYEAYVKQTPLNANGIHIVLIDGLATFLQNEVESKSFVSKFPLIDDFTLPIVIMNSERVERHIIVQSIELSEQCTMSVLSSVAFLDLSANVCDITKAVSHDSRQVRWATPATSAPYPFTYPNTERAVYEPQSTAYTSHLTSRVAALVTSAIQAMTSSNLNWRPSYVTERIYCPIVVLRNGEAKGEVVVPNIPAIQSWLQSILLPHQEVVLVTTDHYVDEHPQLSVAIASSHMTYAASVLSSLESSEKHVERIPFIDSNLLFHELTSVGDRLCDLLLHQTGYGEALRNLLQIEEVKENNGAKVKVGKDDVTSKEKGSRPAAVVPVFVISDVHIHHSRHLGPSIDRNELHPSARPDVPLQPLFDKDSSIAVDSDSSSVLILHSSDPIVNTFSPHTKSWRDSNLSDMDSLIAEGLTRALTGFTAPHTQLESSDILDLTWTHGIHPFSPFGILPIVGDTRHSIFSTSIRRGIAIARAHRVMQRAIAVSHRSLAVELELSDAFRYIHSLHGSSRQAGKSFAGVNSKSQTGGHKSGDRLLDIDKVFPEMMLSSIRNVTKESGELMNSLHFLRESFASGRIDKIINIFPTLEGSIDRVESIVEGVEGTMHLQLKNCHVAFDIDPHLVELISDRKLSQSAYDRMSMSPHARRKDNNAFDAGHFSNLYIAMAVMLLLICVLVVLNIHTRMMKQAKKRM